MRKNYLLFIPLFFAVLAFAACGNTNKSTTENTAEGEATEVAATNAIAHLTKADFIAKVSDFESNPNEWTFKGNKPMLVDFYATWCPPCKQIAPILEELAKTYEGKIDFYKIDVDQEGELAQAYNIKSIPTLYFIPVEGEPEVILGAMSKEDFIVKLDGLLK